MPHQKNLSQAQSAPQEAFLPLEEQHLEAVTGGTGAAVSRSPGLLVRYVHADGERNHPNNGTYIPPTDPATHPYLRMSGLDPANIPKNHSYTFSLDGKDIIKHIRPSY